MAHDLFGSVTRPQAPIGSGSRLTLPLSLAAHALAIAALVVVPLVATDTLPTPSQMMAVVFTPPALPAEPAPPPQAPRPAQAAAVPSDAAPITPPDDIVAEPSTPPTHIDVPTSSFVAGVGPGGSNVDLLAPPPPPQPRQLDPPTPPVRVGGVVATPRKLQHVAPTYPSVALAARLQGLVIIEATIGVDGRVVDARILRSAPLFDEAALDAVRQWLFSPTQLNGQAVPVIMTVTVNFSLQ